MAVRRGTGYLCAKGGAAKRKIPYAPFLKLVDARNYKTGANVLFNKIVFHPGSLAVNTVNILSQADANFKYL